MLPLLLGGYYAIYLAALRFLINAAIFLSLLVSADRLINITKFALIKLRAHFTGRLPQEAWNFATLPNDPAAYPKVRRVTGGSGHVLTVVWWIFRCFGDGIGGRYWLLVPGCGNWGLVG